MSKFNIERRVDISHLGEGWVDCYLTFNTLSYKDVSQILKLRQNKDESEMTIAMFEILKKNYKSGKVFDGTAIVDLSRDELEDMPLELLTKVISELVQGTEEIKK